MNAGTWDEWEGSTLSPEHRKMVERQPEPDGIGDGRTVQAEPVERSKPLHPKTQPELPADMVESLLTLNQAAAFLNISRQSLYAMARNGQVPVSKVGNQWRFAPARLREYLARAAS